MAFTREPVCLSHCTHRVISRTPRKILTAAKKSGGSRKNRVVSVNAKKFVFVQRVKKKIESLEKVKNHLKGQPGIEDYQDVPFFEMVEEGETKVIGREAQSKYSHPKLVINAPTVSADHAKLSIIDGSLYVEDLKSFNGTKINGRNLKVDKEYFVKHETVLSFGDDFLARYQMFEKDDEWDFEGSEEEETIIEDEIKNATLVQDVSSSDPETSTGETGNVEDETIGEGDKDESTAAVTSASDSESTSE